MEQFQMRIKQSGKTVVYTANDLAISSLREFIELCLKDYGVLDEKTENQA